jgi:phosphoribosylformimino-5-aminoimidazole carboxamide ribotide isomerase
VLIIPSIELLGGKCVRLRRGRESEKTVFSNTPAAVARVWERLGARLIDVVDLDGAFQGRPVNIEVIREMTRVLGVPVQVGGGIRDAAALRDIMDAGVFRAVIGTAAVSDPRFLEAACKAYPGRIVAGLDFKGGRAAVKGWKETSDEPIPDMLRRFRGSGVEVVVFTDTARDGMLGGIDASSVRTVLGSGLRVLYAGGVTSYADLDLLKGMEVEGLEGVIIGRALYSGGLRLDRLIAMYQERRTE